MCAMLRWGLARAHGLAARAEDVAARGGGWRVRRMHSLLDCSAPQQWYPLARSLGKRKIVFHGGPTNSGKTHSAFARLLGARCGVYAAPLRLLAWEGFERLRARQRAASASTSAAEVRVVASLLTGQEEEVDSEAGEAATHVSCTVEMLDVSREVEVCVVDEIQMLGDPGRGWAWTRAVLGAPAREVHVCGDLAARALLERLVALTGDELEVVEYERLSPLAAAPRALEHLGEVRPGDCVVTFGRRSLFATKKEIETATRLRCGVIYGSLPPALRKDQARRFNEADGVQVLVATDAVGMGLNLAIRRVIFSEVDKFDGRRRRPLTVSEIKQIGGRAGRYGGAHEGAGLVTALGSTAQLSVISQALARHSPAVRAAGVLPTLEHIELFAVALLPPELRDRAIRRFRKRWAADLAASAAPHGAQPRAPLRAKSAQAVARLRATEASVEGDGSAWGADALRRVFLGANEPSSHHAPPAAAIEPYIDTRELLHADEVPCAADLDGTRGPASFLDAVALEAGDQGDDEEDMQEGATTNDDHAGQPNGRRAVHAAGAAARPAAREDSFLASDPRMVQTLLDKWVADVQHTWSPAQLKAMQFSDVLRLFVERAVVDDTSFRISDCRDVLRIARLIDHVHPLPIRARYRFCMAPADTNLPLVAAALRRYATVFARRAHTVPVGLKPPTRAPRNAEELHDLEAAHAVFDLYLWLARRFPTVFRDADKAERAAATTGALIAEGLEAMGPRTRGATKSRKQVKHDAKRLRSLARA